MDVQACADGVDVCKGARVLTVFSTSKDHGCGAEATCGCLLVDAPGDHGNEDDAVVGTGRRYDRDGDSEDGVDFVTTGRIVAMSRFVM